MRRTRRRLSVGAIYLAAFLAVVIAAAGFALFYGGNNIEGSAADQATPPVTSPLPEQEADVLLVPYRAGSVWGYKSNTGEISIEAQFTDARAFSEGYAFVSVTQNGATVYGVIDASGAWVIDPLYQDAGAFSGGLAPVKYNDRWGFINATGEFVVDPTYEDAGNFCDGLARVLSSEGWGYVDTAGALAVENQYDEAGDFSEGLAFVGTEGTGGTQYYLITSQNETVAPVSIRGVGVYAENFAAVQNADGGWIFLNRRGQQAFDTVFDGAGSFSEGLAAVQVDGLWGYVNTEGQTVIEPQFAAAGAFANGRAPVQNAEGLWGYIDNIGSVVVDYQYLSAGEFSEGYAVVTRNVECGLVDVYGNYKTLYLLDSTGEPDGEEPEAQRTGTVNASSLNVREEPSTDAEVLEQLEDGETVTILEEDGDWYLIQSGDTTGYVSAEYIELSE